MIFAVDLNRQSRLRRFAIKACMLYRGEKGKKMGRREICPENKKVKKNDGVKVRRRHKRSVSKNSFSLEKFSVLSLRK